MPSPYILISISYTYPKYFFVIRGQVIHIYTAIEILKQPPETTKHDQIGDNLKGVAIENGQYCIGLWYVQATSVTVDSATHWNGQI